MQPHRFAKKVLAWYTQYGRHDLPWQKKVTPYRAWISEIMLQQTQVATVIPYYQKFMKRFPSIKSLANADIDTVLTYWTGLGYYARARNLHKTAQLLVTQHSGRFPKTLSELTALPGIGRSTAGAILSLAMQIPAAILDGNVKRVLTRFHALAGWPGHTQVAKQLWQFAERYTPSQDAHRYNQAMMDLGATVCTRTRPKCGSCPLTAHCLAHQQGNETQYPTRAARKVLPKRATVMLIITKADGSILLERRPATGIWGGLWSFPEIESMSNLTRWCKQYLQTSVISYKKMNKISHKFSHFQLTIQPVQVSIQQPFPAVMESCARVWYKLGAAAPGGTAKPVQDLLNLLVEKPLCLE